MRLRHLNPPGKAVRNLAAFLLEKNIQKMKIMLDFPLVWVYTDIRNRGKHRKENIMKKDFRNTIINAYGIKGEDQHNKNLEIMVECFTEEIGVNSWTIDKFAEYASDEKNLDKFISRGAVIL